MATFQQHIESLTGLTITSLSTPTTAHLTQILADGVIATVNFLTTLKPEELPKFTETTNGTGGVAKKGKLLSVAREHNSTTILRPCTPINASLRYEATDIESLNYRSKYNPGYYELNNTIFCVPAPNDTTDNDLVVTQVNYDTGLTAADNYNAGEVLYFPLDYEYLLGLYAAAVCCNIKANDIHNNMPTPPEIPISPEYTDGSTELPELPFFLPPKLQININAITGAISRQDFELADKQKDLFDKKLELYKQDYENENGEYTKELEIFKSELEKVAKDADRTFQVESGEFKSELERYSAEVQFFERDLDEAAIEYKWWTSQYITFLTQYNTALGIKLPPKKQQEPKKKKERETK